MKNKKQILFVSLELTIGGNIASLLSLLSTIDYDKYDVDLLLRKNEGDFIHRLPSQVNLLPAANSNPVSLIMIIKRLLVSLFDGYLVGYILQRLGFKIYKSDFARLQHGTHSHLVFSRKLKKEYDTAVGFMELWPNAYVATYVKAKKKIGWVHTDYIGCGLDAKYDRKNYGRLDHIISVANGPAQSLMQVFPEFEKKISVIENINSEKYVRELSKEDILDMKRNNDDIILLTICRLDCYCKGLDRAITAAATLKRDGFNFKWYIIGDGDDMQKILDLIKEYNVGDCFILLGKRLNPYPYISASDLFVLCSRYEGKPIVVSEAQMLEKPVLVTRYKAAAEQVTDGVNGIIVENNDTAVHEGLKDILNNPDRLNYLNSMLRKCTFSNEHEIQKLYRLMDE